MIEVAVWYCIPYEDGAILRCFSKSIRKQYMVIVDADNICETVSKIQEYLDNGYA